MPPAIAPAMMAMEPEAASGGLGWWPCFGECPDIVCGGIVTLGVVQEFPFVTTAGSSVVVVLDGITAIKSTL